MRVATLRVANIVERLDLLLDWLNREKPDVVALHELESAGEFPAAALRDVGYESLAVGKRSWNGVALLSRGRTIIPVPVERSGNPSDAEVRYGEAAIRGVIYSWFYLPNGDSRPRSELHEKMDWHRCLPMRARELWECGLPVVLLGDWSAVASVKQIYQAAGGRRNASTTALREAERCDANLPIDHIFVSPHLEVVDAGVHRAHGKEGAICHPSVWAGLKLRSIEAGKPLRRPRQLRRLARE